MLAEEKPTLLAISASVWAVVDSFSDYLPGEVTTYTLTTAVDPEGTGTVGVDPIQDVYSEGMDVELKLDARL